MRALLLAAGLTICLTGLVFAADAPSRVARTEKPPQNGAVVYWQAIEALNTQRFTPEEDQRLADMDKDPQAPLSADVKKLVDRASNVLRVMRRATTARSCDWELNYDDGPELLLAHLGELRDLAVVSRLHARVLFEEGDMVGAVDELAATMKMARDAAASPLLVSQLVGVRLEKGALELLARWLPRLDRATLKRLQVRLASLPATPSLADCIRGEQQAFGDWLAREWAPLLVLPDGTKIDEQTQKAWRFMTLLDLSDPEEKRRLADSLATTGQLRAALARLDADYEALAKLSELKPGRDRREQLQLFFDELKPAGKDPKQSPERILSYYLLPGIGKANERVTLYDVPRELLRLAVRVQLDGPSSVEGIRLDVGGAVKYEAKPGGFELRWQDRTDGPSETLRVGEAGK
jgi:hypothetical protein